MLYDHMSRSELLRRLSTHSNSTSSSSRKGTTRVTKQTSAGNSPHIVQRRRTTPANIARAYPRNNQDAFQTREQSLQNHYSSRNSIPFARPMSWQPGSETIHNPAMQMPVNEPAIGNTITGLENLAVSGTPEASVEQSIENAFAMGYGYPASQPASTYEQSPTEIRNYEGCGIEYNPIIPFNVPEQPQYPYMAHVPPSYAMYREADYQLPQWNQVHPEYTTNSQAPPTNLDYLSMKYTVINPQPLKVKSLPQLPKKRSKELVGMGLYDDEDRDFMSKINSAVSDDPSRDSLGKGLKLEETWEPPKDEEGNEIGDQEENYSSDEAEDVDEVPPVQSTQSGIQTALYPTYGDLSNQSFFFSDDDPYTTDGQYTTYMGFGSALQTSQSKLQDATMGSFVWF